MSPNVHPFDVVLADFPGVRRVTERDIRARPSAQGPLPIVVLFLASTKGLKLDRPVSNDYSVQFIGDRIRVVPSVRMQLEQKVPLMVGTELGADSTVPAYSIGLRRCRCRGVEGGRLWNPLVVGLVDEGLTPELRHTLAMRWLQCVRTQQHEFCEHGLEILRKLKIV